MTMVSLFFYRELRKLDPNKNREPDGNDNEEVPHYENEPTWDNEEEYYE